MILANGCITALIPDDQSEELHDGCHIPCQVTNLVIDKPINVVGDGRYPTPDYIVLVESRHCFNAKRARLKTEGREYECDVDKIERLHHVGKDRIYLRL